MPCGMHLKFCNLRINIKLISACLVFCFPFYSSYSQSTYYTVISPAPNSIVSNGNLFVVVSISPELDIITDDIRILIDKTPLNAVPKLNQNRLSFIYENSLPDGKHYLEILVRTTNEPAKIRNIHWFFYININNDRDSAGKIKPGAGKYKEKKMSLSGNIIADNRTEFLSGTGQYLRQEPAFTRTLAINVNVKIKKAQIPIRFFTTTDNYSQIQNRNFFQIGYINKWLDMMYGDINPGMDRFILTGIRMRGIKTVFKRKASSIQFYYGILNDKVEGDSLKYVPGSGFIPPNFINDSVYMLPGTYKRTMFAGRIEVGSKKEYFKIGIHGFKAKDDIESIKYGVSPKDNLAAGADFTCKFFKRSLILSGGLAASIITNDILNGAANKKQIDTTFNSDLPFDPKDFEKYIIINSSTVPITPKNFNYGAYFGSLFYTNKFQSLSFEYRKNGPQFVSLGNPFLRNNYEGYSIGERVWVWKRRLTMNLNYQNFTNDLNYSLISTMQTTIIGSSLYFAYSRKYPSVMVNYMRQNRNTENAIISFAKMDDRFNIFGVNINYTKKFWGLNHNFRLMYNQTNRKDFIRPQSQTNFYNIMLGVGESITEKINISLDGGKTIIHNFEKKVISNLFTFTGNIRWQIKPKRIYTAISVSSNLTRATMYSNETQRFSLIGSFGFKFYKGMGIDADFGYQPFTDKSNSLYNFKEKYIYFRYTYDFDFR